MDGLGGKDYSPNLIAITVLRLIGEIRYAEALHLLFALNKKSIDDWNFVKSILLRAANCHRAISVAVELLNASSANTLDESKHLIPGLYTFSKQTDD